jgi:dephospho-CoA kinase
MFASKPLLGQLNALVHPVAITYAQNWAQPQQSPYVLKEAAIFFETGSDREMDVMLGVSAPLEVRISRVMQRSAFTREKVLSIMANQMDEDKKMAMCDFVIVNDDVQAVLPQVLGIHALLQQRGATV